MLPIGIYRVDQLCHGHVPLAGDFLQAVPELALEADARLAACNVNRTLRNRRLQDFLPQMSQWYYMTWPFGQENPIDVIAVSSPTMNFGGLIDRC